MLSGNLTRPYLAAENGSTPSPVIPLKIFTPVVAIPQAVSHYALLLLI